MNQAIVRKEDADAYTDEQIAIKYLGKEKVEKYISYLFEYAYKEASFLCMPRKGLEFNNLCRTRRNEGLDMITNVIVEIIYKTGIEDPIKFRKNIDIDLYMVKNIEADLHRRYGRDD